MSFRYYLVVSGIMHFGSYLVR